MPSWRSMHQVTDFTLIRKPTFGLRVENVAEKGGTNVHRMAASCKEIFLKFITSLYKVLTSFNFDSEFFFAMYVPMYTQYIVFLS